MEPPLSYHASRRRRAYRWLMHHGILHKRHSHILSQWTEMVRTGAAVPIAKRYFCPRWADILVALTQQTREDVIEIWEMDDALAAEIDAACCRLKAVLHADLSARHSPS